MLPRPVALALTASVALASSSCLVTSVDSFPDPPSTPPFLNGALATPPIGQLVLVDPASSGPVTFSAYVRSEDAGAELEAHLVADWPGTAGTIQSTRLGPGAFSEQRLLSFTWKPGQPTLAGQRLSPGCHPFTLVVTHNFNFQSNVPALSSDADFLVWWVFIGDATSLASFDVSSCPTTSQLPAPTSTTSTTSTGAP